MKFLIFLNFGENIRNLLPDIKSNINGDTLDEASNDTGLSIFSEDVSWRGSQSDGSFDGLVHLKLVLNCIDSLLIKRDNLYWDEWKSYSNNKSVTFNNNAVRYLRLSNELILQEFIDFSLNFRSFAVLDFN